MMSTYFRFPKLKIERLILLQISVMVLFLGLIGGWIIHRGVEIVQAQNQSYADAQTIDTLEKVFNQIVTAESNQRSYLIANNPIYLNYYQHYYNQIQPILHSLKPALLSNGLSLSQVDHFESMIHLKLSFLSSEIQNQQNGFHQKVLQTIHQENRKIPLNNIYSMIQVMQKPFLHNESSNRMLASEYLKNSILWIIIAGSLFLFFAWLSYMHILENLRTRERLNEKIKQISSLDGLTGLLNRSTFLENANSILEQSKQDNEMIGILFIDLDGFKNINDTYGHATGDEVLKKVASNFREAIRSMDYIGRFGGDEFVILVRHAEIEGELITIAQKIMDTFSDPYLKNISTKLSASIGISVFPRDGDHLQTLLSHSDHAMYRVKQTGGHRVEFFSSALNENIRYEQQLKNDLYGAIDRNELEIYYQPIIHASSQTLCGSEALIRWNRGNGELLTPGQFLHLAESSGLLSRITMHVLEKSITQTNMWLKQLRHPFLLSVNLSGQDIRDIDSFYNFLDNLLKVHSFPPHMLQLEITENDLLKGEAVEALQKLHSLGVRLAIDDFGTGYSSLAYLHRFPFDHIKIDRSFIQTLPHNEYHERLVRAIITMGKLLGLTAVAEGVESAEQEKFLIHCGIEYLQGYYYNPPLSSNRFQETYIQPLYES